MSKRAPLTFEVEPLTPAPQTARQASLPANIKTSKQPNGKTKTVKERGTFIAGHVAPEAAKQFRLLVVQRDTTTQDLLIEAINDIFAKYGLSRIA